MKNKAYWSDGSAKGSHQYSPFDLAVIAASEEIRIRELQRLKITNEFLRGQVEKMRLEMKPKVRGASVG